MIWVIPKMDLSVRELDIYLVVNSLPVKDSGERSRAHVPSYCDSARHFVWSEKNAYRVDLSSEFQLNFPKLEIFQEHHQSVK